MIFNRLPSMTTLVEIFIIIALGMWVFSDPSGAGHALGNIVHGLAHAARQIPVFIKSI